MNCEGSVQSPDTSSFTTAIVESPEDDIQITASLFCGEGRVCEVRCLNNGNVSRGFYNDPEKLSADIKKVQSSYKGIYITLNPVNPVLLERSPNIMGVGESTSDADVCNYAMLLVDVDAGQNSNTNSTDAEHCAAINRAYEIMDAFVKIGFPEPVIADSGNGAHLLWKTELPLSDENRGLVKNFLQAVALDFPELPPLEKDSNRGVHVDTANHNPGRITKLYGTRVCKGRNTEQRPWRNSAIISIPSQLEPVSKELLNQVAAKASKTIKTPKISKHDRIKRSTTCINLKNYLKAMGYEHIEKAGKNGSIVYDLKDYCVVSKEDHGGCFAIQFSDGGAWVGCHHNHCNPNYNHAQDVWNRDRPVIEEKTPELLPTIEPLRPEVIITRRDLTLSTNSLIAGIKLANHPPVLYSRDRCIVRVVTNEHGHTLIETADFDIVANELERMVRFVEMKPVFKGNEVANYQKIPVWHNKSLVRNLMAERDLPFPSLMGITEVPFFTPRDELITEPGYNEETGYFYVPDPELDLPEIPEQPTREQIDDAKNQLYEVLVDFNFEDENSRTNAIAAMLTAVLFPMIDGCIPLALFDKPQLGCGATLLARICGILMLGKEPVFLQPESNEDKWDKAFEGALINGNKFNVWDDLKGAIQSKKLDGCLTAKTVSVRILGTSDMIDVPTKAFYGITGSNIRLDQDTVRRVYRIRLTTNVARPWERTGFKHQIPQYIFEQRGNLLAAIYTLTKAWIQNGKPVPDTSLVPMTGSFDEWRDTIGGILQVAGIQGFLSNTASLYKDTDLGRDEWFHFLESWYNLQQVCSPGSPEKDVQELVEWYNIGKNSPAESSDNDLHKKFFNCTPTGIRIQIDAENSNIIGNILAKHRDAIYGIYRLRREELSHRRKVYSVNKISDSG